MHSSLIILSAAALVAAQNNPPPAPVLLTSTKSGVLPVLPTPFNGVETLEGAIIMKAPVNASYLPVNGPAVVQSNLPAATYVATLPEVPFNGLTGTVIRGTVTASSEQGATGTTFTFNLTGFPNSAQYGPFPYHIHDMIVPADGNCTSTMGHFDYTNAGEYYTCDTTQPQNCQVGDLAGKHGKAMNATFVRTYTDNYLSTDPSSPYFFGAKSFVIHTTNTTRLTCANFIRAQGQAPSSTASVTYGTAPPTSATSAVASYTGSANKLAAGAAVAGVAGLFGLLVL